MKQCPDCNSAALYEDAATHCPDCGATLVPYRPEESGAGDTLRWEDIFQMEEEPPILEEEEEVVTATTTRTGGSSRGGSGRSGGASRSGSSRSGTSKNGGAGRNNTSRNSTARNGGASRNGNARTAQPFEERNGRRVTLHGRVSEVSSGITRYQSRFHKLFNSLFRMEPYQLAHTTHRCVLWIEEDNGRLAERMREVTYYGDIEGQVIPGYRMTVRAVQRHGELVAQSLYNDDLEQRVRGRLQIPAWAVWIVTALVMSIVISLLGGLVGSISDSGGLIAWILDILGAVAGFFIRLLSPIMPWVVIGGAAWYFLRRRRRYRR